MVVGPKIQSTVQITIIDVDYGETNVEGLKNILKELIDSYNNGEVWKFIRRNKECSALNTCELKMMVKYNSLLTNVLNKKKKIVQQQQKQIPSRNNQVKNVR